jgi:hypothetical protein
LADSDGSGRYTIWSALDGQPCLDHDRASGVRPFFFRFICISVVVAVAVAVAVVAVPVAVDVVVAVPVPVAFVCRNCPQ